MPQRPLRLCSSPGCTRLVPSGKCERHAAIHAERERKRKADYEARRPPRRPRAVEVWDPRWRELRARHLETHPFCVQCTAKATHVDHIVTERVAPERVLDPTNLQSLCHVCHSRKTAARDGAYGNPTK